MVEQPNPESPDSLVGDILIVDDLAENLHFLSTVLTSQGYKVRSALSGPVAVNVAKAAQPDLVLLDIKMPDMDGYQVCRQLKADPLTQDIPIIFLSALTQTTDIVKAFNTGGIDYIPKPFQSEELLARVNTHLKLRLAQAQVQKLNAELEQRVLQRTVQLEQEIGERPRAQEQVLHIATHDRLTNLPSRILLIERVNRLLAHHPRRPFVLMLLKCNQLQTINNSLGHHAVDQLLIAIGRRLEIGLDAGMLLTNYDEETFAILLEGDIDKSEVIQIAHKFQLEFSLPFQIENYSIYLQSSIGLVLASQSYDQASYVLRDANTALYQARTKGVGKIQIFNPEMYYRAASFFEIQNDLYRALENQELQLIYQPILSLENRSLKGAEALVRWHHPQRGLILPDQFIPIAEETELILALDRLVLRQACYQLRTWQEHGWLTPSFLLQINLSSLQLGQVDLLDYLTQVLAETQVNPKYLALEITEYGLMQKDTAVLRNLEQLRHYQINVSIDDFGTGYSCLSYLHSLNVDNIKIDKSFIHQIDTTKTGIKVLRAIINLARELEMTVTAEGIETEEQLASVTQLGCEFGQGYFLGMPTDGNTLLT